MESGKTTAGVLLGVGIGALLGILFAPAKGTKTRRRILDKGQNYTNELKGKFDEMYQDVSEKCNSFLDDAKEATAQK